MRDKLKVVEVDRRPAIVRRESEMARDQHHLDRRIRAALDDRRRAWEQGFAAGIEAAASAQLARGTRDFGDEPTTPYPIIDPDLIMVD